MYTAVKFTAALNFIRVHCSMKHCSHINYRNVNFCLEYYRLLHSFLYDVDTAVQCTSVIHNAIPNAAAVFTAVLYISVLQSYALHDYRHNKSQFVQCIHYKPIHCSKVNLNIVHCSQPHCSNL